MTARARSPRTDRLDRKLGSYATAARSVLRTTAPSRAKKLATMTAAAGAGLTMAPAADATVIYSGVQNLVLNASGTNLVRLNLDLDAAGATADVILGIDQVTGTFTGYVPAISALSSIQGARATSVNGFVANLPAGSLIGPGTTGFALGPGYADLRWFQGNTSYAGVRFNIAGQPHYAWLRLAVSAAGDQITVIDWAYEDQSNTGILAGNVPEPSTALMTGLGLLALGARGVRHRRKRLAQLAQRAPTR